jgi:hypothetical protein
MTKFSIERTVAVLLEMSDVHRSKGHGAGDICDDYRLLSESEEDAARAIVGGKFPRARDALAEAYAYARRRSDDATQWAVSMAMKSVTEAEQATLHGSGMEISHAIHLLHTYGGHFASKLGDALTRADSDNARRIMTTWADLLAQYQALEETYR